MTQNKDFSANLLFDALPSYSTQDALWQFQQMPQEIDSIVENPIAQVYLDLSVPHMSQIFDYEIPVKFKDLKPGARVKVTLGAQNVEGFVARRCKTTLAAGKLRPIQSLVSNIPVLQPQILELLEKLSEKYICPIADLFRFAIPQRHARAEKDFFSLPEAETLNTKIVSSFIAPTEYQNSAPLLNGNLTNFAPISVVHPLPQHDIELFVPAIQNALETEKSVLLIVPTPREIGRITEKIQKIFPLLKIAKWHTENNHATRYQQFLSALHGRTRIIVGTRAAIWAPLKNLGLILQFDDAHYAYRERRKPYFDTRDVLATRAEIEKAKFFLVNIGPSVAGCNLLKRNPVILQELASPEVSKFKKEIQHQIISPQLNARKHLVPHLLGANQFKYESSPWSRMPSSLFAIVREGLKNGSVLIVVPKSGYIPKIACQYCNALAECKKCGGRLEIPAPNAPIQCTRCGFVEKLFQCQKCGRKKLKIKQLGSERTAFEIGRAFPNIPINLATSNTANDADEIATTGQIVIATPGSELRCATGYSAAVVLDCGYLLAANSLDAESQFLRTIAKIMPFVRTRDDGGKVLLVGDVPNQLINVLGRWDYVDWELNSLHERQELKLPPVNSWYEISGLNEELKHFLGLLQREISQIFESQNSDDRDKNNVETKAFNQLNDPLSTGGIHNILPNANILGAYKNVDGTYRIFVCPDFAVNRDYIVALNRVNRIASLNHITSSIKIKINPSL